MTTYFDLIPTDISNIIVSHLNSDDLENFILSLDNLSGSFQGSFWSRRDQNEQILLSRESKKDDLISLLNWRVIHSHHFGFFRSDVKYNQYLKLLQLENVIEILNLKYSIDELLNLEVLDLSNNQLTNIPKEIGILSNLQRLDLYNNQL